ncbi:MAG: hypothetical protein LBT00_02240 [Spirochaetaceae bacterium]|nr:hypothetical protein [Spirochaetaceae bacterium]
MGRVRFREPSGHCERAACLPWPPPVIASGRHIAERSNPGGTVPVWIASPCGFAMTAMLCHCGQVPPPIIASGRHIAERSNRLNASR